MTLGGWCYEQPGFITSMNLNIPESSPWEIAIPENISGESIENDGSVKEMPHIVQVQGFSFTPIHNFVPQIQKNTFSNGKLTGYGQERYLSLKSKSGESYDTDLESFDPRGAYVNKNQIENAIQTSTPDLAINYQFDPSSTSFGENYNTGNA